MLSVWVACLYFPRLQGTRGVPPERETRFQGPTFTCDDGKIIPIERVNDNHCDCLNGEDEPGTSACSIKTTHERTFYCPNTGHRSKLIYRSQVDDGVCDCCDGSDEGSGKCPNRCAEARNREEDELQRKSSALEEGKRKKAEIIRQSQAERLELEQHVTENRKNLESINREILQLSVGSVVDMTNRTSSEYGTSPCNVAMRRTTSETKPLEYKRRRLMADIEAKMAILDRDYGPSGEFYPYRSFSLTREIGEYEYTVAYFDRITQRNRRDNSEVNCGEAKGFGRLSYSDWGASVDYSMMEFGDGEMSWSGLVRSTSVRLLCGAVDEIVDVKEDQPCKYSVVIRSPLACVLDREPTRASGEEPETESS